MTVSRQSQLFAAEDWKTAYKIYSQVNFQAYDFDSMRAAMVEYVRTNFPENFNDYIESSEFIAIIELLAYLSQSLAFRMDVNSRENFLETAERRDSVYKLARMLGYNPKRNIAASGILKVMSIRTNEPLTDSLGNALGGRIVFWNDANNTQSYEQFITIMNSAMSKSNRFTAPIKQGFVGGIETELYQINTPSNNALTFGASVNVNGSSKAVDIVNPDFTDNGFFFERHPNPSNRMNMLYRNDGKGAGSANTGFFTLFRQGNLEFVDYDFTTALQSRVRDVNVANINESDVYLQEIDVNGNVLARWQKIQNVVGQTLNYNSVDLNTRKLYAVESLGDQGIRLRFPDGNFGEVPRGIFRLWYRSSDPTRYTIQPADARGITIPIRYENAEGKQYTLTLTCDLQYRVANSLPAESLAAIKDRAPQVYYTQNRMVSAQDYNVFPQSQSGNITKLKAVNKTHAGHSRYIDINDPTGAYHNVDTFADDAYLYVQKSPSSEQIVVNNNTTPLEVVASIIPTRLKQYPINNFIYHVARNIWTDPNQNGSLNSFRFLESDNVVWNVLPIRSTGKTGYITEQITDSILINNPNTSTISSFPRTRKFRMLKENTMLKFVNPDNIADYKWVRIVNVQDNGQITSSVNTGIGPWTLSEEVNGNWRLEEVIVSMRKLFTSSEAITIENAIKARQTFALGYHLLDDNWYVIPNTDLTADSKAGDYAINASSVGPYSWLILMEYEPLDQFSYKYHVTMRGADYVVQSKNDLKFYDVKNVRVVDSTNKSSQDVITFGTVNTQPGAEEVFEWVGNAWRNREVGTLTVPEGLRALLPLKTRDTSWKDVDISWISNFGILRPEGGTTIADYATNNRYATDTIVPLNPYFLTGALSSDSNVVIQDNTGVITSVPNKITIPFNDNTFGVKVVTDSGTPFITYRQVPDNGSIGSEVIFYAEVGEDPVSYGETGAVEDAATIGRLYFISYDAFTGEGVLEYRQLQYNDYHYSVDDTGEYSQDKLRVYYRNNKDKLDAPVKWEILDVFKEPDGFTDPRKVKVVPFDTDDDLVPDRPRQFTEYVGPTDIVLFEYFTDFDGYRYDRPISGVIMDYRAEDSIVVDNAANKITAGSGNNSNRLSDVDWILVKNKAIADTLENKENAAGIVVYAVEENKTYQVIPLSSTPTQSLLKESPDHFVRAGRGLSQAINTIDPQDGTIRWQHVASNDVRIDPSISNIIEMTVLTTSYYNDVQKWLARPTGEFPLEPTSNELATELAGLNTYKSASDSLVYKSGKFKLLFGNQADDAYRARFRVVKLSDQLSDNELKTSIITAINEYFDVINWEFGEAFYFTELATYIHQSLGSAIGSIVILPKNNTGQFGEMFQVKAESSELFISTATVSDIEIINRIDNQTLRTDR